MFRNLIFIAVVYAASILDDGQSDEIIVSDCMLCICEASTNCNANFGCIIPYPGGYFCGPFRISWPYWADAGKPTIENGDPNDVEAFENCVKDLYCAAQTVRQYMKNFGDFEDCNRDGKVTCDDRARMHKMGGYACNDTRINITSYYKSFKKCIAGVRA